MTEVVMRGGTILTLDSDHRVLTGDVAAVDGAVVHVGGTYTPQTSDYTILDCAGGIVMPGFVQAHTHMCQTLARGRADDLELLDWLHQVIWPYEAALDERTITAAAELACAELLLGGTTAILDMGTVHHTDQLFMVAERSGIRATIGNAMMDAPDPAIPPGLRETTQRALDEAARLRTRWHGAASGRLRFAYSPRFALSCTDELLREVGAQAQLAGLPIHVHASENRAEIALVRERFGKTNIEALDDAGLLGPRTCIAHAIHLTDAERAILATRGAHVCTCPSSNLKLASGICPVPELIAAGISLALGSDGAACSNTLDALHELRLAALQHRPRCGSKTLPAPEVVRIATRGGAEALGIGDRVGAIEVGKRGDIIAIDVQTLHAVPAPSPWSQLAYSARSSDVRHVVIDGKVVVRDRTLLTLDVAAVRANAIAAAVTIFH